LRQELQEAKKSQELDYLDLLHTKFKYGGTSIEEGFDCFTLASEMARRRGIVIPNVNKQKIPVSKASIMFADTYNKELFREVPKGKNVLVLMKNPFGQISHIGFMIDSNNFIHMTGEYGCLITKTSDATYKKRIVGYYLPKDYNP